jgi:hypothetical protein
MVVRPSGYRNSGGVVYRQVDSLLVPLILQPAWDPDFAVILPVRPLKTYLNSVEDKRKITNKIGESRSQQRVISIQFDRQTPSKWVHDAIDSIFRAKGINVVDDATKCDRQVKVTLLEFWAEESPDYKAHMVASVQVQDSSGKILWRAIVRSGDKTWGDGLSVSRYQQVFSTSMQRFAQGLLTNPLFMRAAAGADE